MTALAAYIRDRLAGPVDPSIAIAAREIARKLGGVAVLFYGSMLRTGDLEGVADFYVLTRPATGTSRLRPKLLWPDVSYHEVAVGNRTISAKVATMPIDIFAEAASGRLLDTTIWARFVQRSALIWAASGAIEARVVEAVSAAAIAAARFAAIIGPRTGTPSQYWSALFLETYQAELRFERAGREMQIIGFDVAHYDRLLALAWSADDIVFTQSADGCLRPTFAQSHARGLFDAWQARARAAKLLNVARLVKAAFTFDGAARYALWKIHRHTGIRVAMTPFRERHPILAAPGVLWRVWMTPAR